MRLTRIYASGFRCFHAAGPLELAVRTGLTMLVGENDSGKSAIIDAVRLVLGTRGEDRHRLHASDFSIVDGLPERELTILATLGDLTDAEAARFMEWCTVDGGVLRLHVSLKGTLERLPGEKGSRANYRRRTGPAGDGPPVEGALREYLAAAYLRPLRDAARELSAGRQSRLSRILASLPDFARAGSESGKPPAELVDAAEEITGTVEPPAREATAPDSTESPSETGAPGEPEQIIASAKALPSGAPDPAEKRTLREIIEETDRAVRKHPAVARVEKRVNDEHLAHMSLGDRPLRAKLGIGAPDNLSRLLERLELVLDDAALPGVRRGLGLNNILFMVAELLLLAENDEQLPVLLIEEPEAHLHPQLLSRVLDMLTKNLGTTAAPQLVLTTHSPLLASSANLEEVVVVRQGSIFPLGPGRTRLDDSDYVFLRRFLDSTKANLFFARGIVLVEGLSEVLLLPAIARRLGHSFEERGVSLVNVGNVGFFRYARIFQSPTKDVYLPVPVACVCDLDLLPKEADGMKKDKQKERLQVAADPTAQEIRVRRAALDEHSGGSVKVFSGATWTLEYDLAEAGLARELHVAVALSRDNQKARDKSVSDAETSFAELQVSQAEPRALAREVFRPILAGTVSKVAVAEHLASIIEESPDPNIADRFPAYLVDAVKHAAGVRPESDDHSNTGEAEQ